MGLFIAAKQICMMKKEVTFLDGQYSLSMFVFGYFSMKKPIYVYLFHLYCLSHHCANFCMKCCRWIEFSCKNCITVCTFSGVFIAKTQKINKQTQDNTPWFGADWPSVRLYKSSDATSTLPLQPSQQVIVSYFPDSPCIFSKNYYYF